MKRNADFYVLWRYENGDLKRILYKIEDVEYNKDEKIIIDGPHNSYIIKLFGGICMRKCIRCQTEMVENCSMKIEGAGYGIVMTKDDKSLFANRIGKPKVAICPACGEVSIYVENTKDLAR